MQRDPNNRLKNWNGTVHFRREGRYSVVACGSLRTHGSWLYPTVEDVTCERCIAMFGADTPSDHRDVAPAVDDHVARRAAERAARKAARS